VVEIKLTESENVFGYLDKEKTHNFICSVLENQGVSDLQMSWAWDFRAIDGS